MFHFIFRHQRCRKYLYAAVLLVTALTAGLIGCRDTGPVNTVLLETVELPEQHTQTPDCKSPALDGVKDSDDYVFQRLEEKKGESLKETSDDAVYVYVCGCVKAPGVYRLDCQSRIFEAIEAAGGMTDEAAVEWINLAMKLTDQMQIYIPSKEEILAQKDCLKPGDKYPVLSETSKEDDLKKININTATTSQLDTLPGIGASKALDIVNYREDNGGFSNIEDLMNIPGIKQGVFDKIKDLVTVD